MLAATESSPRFWERFKSGHILALLPFLCTVLAWQLLVHVFHVRPIFLPPLESFPNALWEMFVVEQIWRDVLVSTFRVVTGFFVAILLATPLGVLMGFSGNLNRMIAPYLGFVRYMPVPVFIPICILWLGSGDLQKSMIIFLGAFFQLVLMIQDAAAGVPKAYFEAASMLGAPRRDLLIRVLLPAAMPRIFESWRISMGWAWTYLVVAELVGATTGVGYYIVKAQRYLQIPKIFAAMALIGFLGLITDALFLFAHGRLFSWDEKGPKK